MGRDREGVHGVSYLPACGKGGVVEGAPNTSLVGRITMYVISKKGIPWKGNIPPTSSSAVTTNTTVSTVSPYFSKNRRTVPGRKA